MTMQWLGSGEVGVLPNLQPLQLTYNYGRLPQCPIGQYWDGTKCVVQGPPALKAAPVYYAKVINGPVMLREGRTGQSRINQAWKMIRDAWAYIGAATHRFSILPAQFCTGTSTGTTCTVDVTGLPLSSINAILATLWPSVGSPENFTPTSTTLSGPIDGVESDDGNAELGALGSGDVGQRLPQCPLGYYWNGTKCVQPIPFSPFPHVACPSGQYWDGTKCVVSTGPALRAAPKVRATIEVAGRAVTSGTTGQGAVNAARNYANSNGIRIASGVGTITFFANTRAQADQLTQILHIYAIPLTFIPTRGAPSNVSGPTTGQLGNPDAGVSLSIGVGGLLLFGLAAYGVWRLARG